jgi:hypothetical protein
MLHNNSRTELKEAGKETDKKQKHIMSGCVEHLMGL